MMEYEFDELIRPIPDGLDWWSSIKQFPVKITDQSFGYELQKDDMKEPDQISDVSPWPRTSVCTDLTGHSLVEIHPDSFQVEMSIREFKDYEIDICLEKGFLIIHGKHEERDEGDGTTVRSFTRRYMLQSDCELVPIDGKIYRDGGTVGVHVPRKIRDDTEKIKMDVSIDSTK